MSPPNSAPSDSGTGRPSRRGVLVGVGAAGLLGLLGLRACVPWRTDAVPDDLRTLTRGEARLFMRVIPVFLPLAGTALVPLYRIDVLRNIDRQAARLPREARALLRQALFALDHGAVLLGGRLTRAANLDEAALHAWLVAWSEGGALQRGAFGAVKQLVALGYFGDPAAWPPLQYDGPITGPRAIPRLGNQPLPEV